MLISQFEKEPLETIRNAIERFPIPFGVVCRTPLSSCNERDLLFVDVEPKFGCASFAQSLQNRAAGRADGTQA